MSDGHIIFGVGRTSFLDKLRKTVSSLTFIFNDSLAYIHISVRHLECEILKAISEESVGWTKAILIDNLAEREQLNFVIIFCF